MSSYSEKTAVLLSGGVDSSVALVQTLREKCLQNAGNLRKKTTFLEAFYLKIWLEDELSYLGSCPFEEDLFYARAVCEKYGVPLHIVNLQEQYFQHVVQYAISELKHGYTPSPDIFCNTKIKFGVFWDYLKQHFSHEPFEKIVTGHYSQILEKDGKFWLAQAPDAVKDQSYFLAHLSQQQLARLHFPLGNKNKSQVRALAKEWDLPNKARRDSQGICFLGKLKYSDFVRHYLPDKVGVIKNRDTGETLGEHRGHWLFTIGQRQGIRLSQGPWYVVEKDIDSNVVYVSHQEMISNALKSVFLVDNVSFLTEPLKENPIEIKLRHGPSKIKASWEKQEDERLKICLHEPDRGIAPGQYAVFYQGDICYGLGRICVVLS